MLGLKVNRYEHAIIGLPARAIVLTNSERMTSACDRRWWFSEVEGLRSRETKTRPLRHGQAWALLTEDVHRHWMEHDTPYPAGREETVIGPVLAGWQQQQREQPDPEWDPAKDAEGLRRVLQGWFRQAGGGRMPADGYRVIGMEVALAAPVVGPGGSPYAPVTYVVPTPRGLRLARTGEGHTEGAQVVRWPWYQVGRLDALYQHRESGDLLVWEGKSSKDPSGYLQGLTVDPQVPGYIWLLRHHMARWGAKRVTGYLYDVSSSTFQADPPLLKAEPVKILGPDGEPLKVKGRNSYELDEAGEPVLRSRGLSRATSAGTVPSWRYAAAVAAHGFDRAEYREHIQRLEAEVDPRLYVQDFGTVGEEDVARYALEIYGVARQFAQGRRDAALATKPGETHSLFPRNPVCRVGGSGCAFRGPCLRDGGTARAEFRQVESMVWHEGQLALPNNTAPAAAQDQELGW